MFLKRKECLYCKNNFLVNRPVRMNVAKFCSYKCSGLFKKGKPITDSHKKNISKAQKGRKLSKEWCKAISLSRMGKNNPNWKHENDLTVKSIHAWVRNRKKAKICEHCGVLRDEKMLHWANIDHSYKRNLDDYICLCVICHWKYDIKFNNKLKKDSSLKPC
jgi:hypothetical protein